LGLCEGNYCKGGAEGKDPGHGIAILTHLTRDPTKGCAWEFVKQLHLPSEADFIDYADMAVYYHGGSDNMGDLLTVGVVSQEDSALWLGHLDTVAWEFKGPGKVVHLPRSDTCDIKYCNIEGISFLDRYQVLSQPLPPPTRTPLPPNEALPTKP
jgi:hypothetical protein